MVLELKNGKSVNLAEERYGTENLAKIIIYTGELEDEIFKIAADKRVSFWEALGLIGDIKKVSALAKHAVQVKEEIKDLSVNEMEKLAPIIAEAYELPTKNVQVIIDEYVIPLLSILSESYTLVQNIRNRKTRA